MAKHPRRKNGFKVDATKLSEARRRTLSFEIEMMRLGRHNSHLIPPGGELDHQIPGVRNAIYESLGMHVRQLAQFLFKCSDVASYEDDMLATDFVPDWVMDPPPAPVEAALEWVHKRLAHMTYDRNAKEDFFDFGPACDAIEEALGRFLALPKSESRP
jgi:hypothetical protein